MIRFVCGRSGSGKSEYVMNAVRKAGACGEKVILIVPEQQAVALENRTARELDPTVLLSLEVLTFTRLCDRVSRDFGGFFYNLAGKPAKRLLMWAALESVRGLLTYYRSARTERLVPVLLQAVKELRAYRVTPRDLEEAAHSLSSGDRIEEMLSKKLNDIAAVYAAYDELLHRSFSDIDELPEHTAKTVAEKRFFTGKSVFIDSFYSFTPAQQDIVRSIMRDADELTLTVACPAEQTGEPQFEHIWDYFKKMKSLAEEYGGFETISLESGKRFRQNALAVLERGIWDFSLRGTAAGCDGIKIIKTNDRYSEADAAAAEICRLVRCGARFSEIAVIARSAERLEGITDAVMRKKGIPHYTSRRKKLENSPAAQLLLASLRVPSYGWRREDILSVAKTGLLPFEGDECDLFEKYIKMWRIRGRRAYAEDGDWGMDPYGFKQSSREKATEVLRTVNSARRKLCDPLSAFCEIFEGGKVRADRCAAAMYKLLTDWDVPEAISAMSRRLRTLGYTTESAECLRMWDALMSVLDTLAMTIPDAEGDAESFSVMLEQIISATDSGTIPTGIDEVAFGSADMMRTENPRHVIVLGAVDGEFPASVSSDGIFTETDRVMLEGCGIELSDSIRYASGMEMFWFYKAVSCASESVAVIIPEKSGQNLCSPSSGAMRIMELFSGIEAAEYDKDDPENSVWTANDLDRFIRQGGISGEAARMLMPECIKPPSYDVPDAANEAISPETMKKINGDILYLTQSKLDRYASCPFMYFADYAAGLQEDADARIDAGDTGSFVHKVLEEFFTEVKDMDFPIPEHVERRICGQIVERHVKRLWDKGAGNGRQQFLLRKLCRNLQVFIHSLNEEFAQGLFRPWRFEQSVGGGAPGSIPSPEFTLPGGMQIQMKGVIDRIDVFRDGQDVYVRVVDYKTGSKEFHLSDLYKGQNLQLLLYLFTVWKCPPGEFRKALAGAEGRIIPAGALYFSAKPGQVSCDYMLYGGEGLSYASDAVSRTGIVLSDRRIIEAMDRDISGKYAPVKKDKNGGIRNGGGLADMDRFGSLYEDITNIVKSMGESISGGFAGATPKRRDGGMPCEYCAYYPVCRRRREK